MAEGRGARGRRRDVLARRQAHVPVRRGRADLRDRERSRRSIAGKSRGRSSRARGASTSAGSTRSATSRASSRASSRCRTRCRTAASWASAASSWRRRRSTSIRSARRAASASPSRPIASAATGCSATIDEYEFWTFDLENYRVLSRTPFRGRPRMGLRVSSSGNVIYIHTAGNTIDLYDAATFKLPAHDHARRRHDRRSRSLPPEAA